MFLNGLQLRVISLPILKLFAFLSLCSGWVERARCSAKQRADKLDIRQMHSFGKQNGPFSLHSLSVSSHLLSLEKGNTVNSIPPLSSSLVFVSQCTQLLSPSFSYTHKSNTSTGWNESIFCCS